MGGNHIGEIDEDNPPEGEATFGLFFIELNNDQLASRMLNLHGTQFSKSSTWCVSTWSEWLETENIEEEFHGPRVEYHRCSVWWGDHRRGGAVLETNFESTLAKVGKTVLTDSECSWSPLESFMTSKHEGRGIKTWCQERGDWVESKKFQHAGAIELDWDWSPQETYLVTLAIEDTKDGEIATVQLWNGKTGERRRAFDATYHLRAGFKWPYLKWSNDDKYFAWIHTSKWKKVSERHNLGKADADRFVVFDSETCLRLDQKSISCPKIRLLSFSPGPRARREGEPNKPLIAFGTKGSQDKPTNICLMEIPSKERVVTSSHFDVFNADLLWHPNGQWLCAKIAKKK